MKSLIFANSHNLFFCVTKILTVISWGLVVPTFALLLDNLFFSSMFDLSLKDSVSLLFQVRHQRKDDLPWIT